MVFGSSRPPGPARNCASAGCGWDAAASCSPAAHHPLLAKAPPACQGILRGRRRRIEVGADAMKRTLETVQRWSPSACTDGRGPNWIGTAPPAPAGSDVGRGVRASWPPGVHGCVEWEAVREFETEVDTRLAEADRKSTRLNSS